MIGRGREAKLYLGDARYDIMQPGDHVVCSVTGQKIPLPNLRYWSVDLQEVYASSEISLKRTIEMRKRQNPNKGDS